MVSELDALMLCWSLRCCISEETFAKQWPKSGKA